MNKASSGLKNVRMSALLKRGGRTDDRPDKTSGPDMAVTCENRKRPDETSGRTSGQLLIFPDEFPGTGDLAGAAGWPDRLAAMVAEAARRERKRAVRQAFAERRAAGLAIRHQIKPDRVAAGAARPGRRKEGTMTAPTVDDQRTMLAIVRGFVEYDDETIRGLWPAGNVEDLAIGLAAYAATLVVELAEAKGITPRAQIDLAAADERPCPICGTPNDPAWKAPSADLDRVDCCPGCGRQI